MDTNESRVMQQLEKEVSHLNLDVLKVKDQVGNVQKEMGQISNNVKEILKILAGNETVHGDQGLTGRLFEAEKRIRILEEWKDKHADFVVSDHRPMKKRVQALEDEAKKNRITIGVWCGVATGLSLIAQFIMKYVFHL